MTKNVVFLAVVFVFIILDVISGLLGCLKAGEFKSSRMREGLVAKLGEICAVGLMIVIEHALPYLGISADIPFVSFITIYIVVMEIGSCIENLGKINPALVKPMAKLFKQLKDVTGQEVDNENG